MKCGLTSLISGGSFLTDGENDVFHKVIQGCLSNFTREEAVNEYLPLGSKAVGGEEDPEYSEWTQHIMRPRVIIFD